LGFETKIVGVNDTVAIGASDNAGAGFDEVPMGDMLDSEAGTTVLVFGIGSKVGGLVPDSEKTIGDLDSGSVGANVSSALVR
jgi:hypothetical protein